MSNDIKLNRSELETCSGCRFVRSLEDLDAMILERPYFVTHHAKKIFKYLTDGYDIPEIVKVLAHNIETDKSSFERLDDQDQYEDIAELLPSVYTDHTYLQDTYSDPDSFNSELPRLLILLFTSIQNGKPLTIGIENTKDPICSYIQLAQRGVHCYLNAIMNLNENASRKNLSDRHGINHARHWIQGLKDINIDNDSFLNIPSGNIVGDIRDHLEQFNRESFDLFLTFSCLQDLIKAEMLRVEDIEVNYFGQIKPISQLVIQPEVFDMNDKEKFRLRMRALSALLTSPRDSDIGLHIVRNSALDKLLWSYSYS